MMRLRPVPFATLHRSSKRKRAHVLRKQPTTMFCRKEVLQEPFSLCVPFVVSVGVDINSIRHWIKISGLILFLEITRVQGLDTNVRQASLSLFVELVDRIQGNSRDVVL